jgi:hypothetical protein
MAVLLEWNKWQYIGKGDIVAWSICQRVQSVASTSHGTVTRNVDTVGILLIYIHKVLGPNYSQGTGILD